MYIVDIHPFTGRVPNKEVKITSYKFKTLDEAVEFINHYNSHSVVKIAILAANVELETI